MSTFLIFAALGAREIVPVLVALSIVAIIYVIFSIVSQRDGKTEERLDRIGKLSSPDGASGLGGTPDRFQDLLERAAPALAKPLQASEKEENNLKMKLAHGGWRSENAVTVYNAMRLVSLLVGAAVAGITIYPSYGFSMNGILYMVLLTGIFFYIPTLLVTWRVNTRKEQIFLGLPDALDLMVVCVEAGLGLDAAMRKVCEEMGSTFPIISEEFSICNFQLQMGRPRREVLHDLGVRTGVDDMKALAAILIQADRFGSSIAQALRVQSDSMRTRRRQMAEEKAAMTAVKLIFPLVLFIFPAIFVVLVGPAAIQIADRMLNK
ncbi:Bacterial type II secretion system protein F domain protein [Planctomycetes bacterium Pan216]|uniref:Bacterial type II secretion system protein F domain protein n=1 Tax=Kolteria novifilia TaxID=2527975 RepID=A0A518BCI4_9BACT|nr:Bacterial type II secretion system protein F domain protein [Planctomycetes bacterium Pan216]